MADSKDDVKLDLKVSDANGAITHFKVKKSTKFRKILAVGRGVRRGAFETEGRGGVP